MPPWVKEKAKRLAKIREAKAALEEEARQKPRLEGVPEARAQRNFTDPESRILRVGDSYVQGYNCQAAVDAESQVIVGQRVGAGQDDHRAFLGVVDEIEAEVGRRPREVSADSNYCSESNLAGLEERGIRGYVATGRREHRMSSATNNAKAKPGPRARVMRLRLRRGGWRSRYRLRKQTVEPVFGQIKEARGFRRFLMRGLERVEAEWALLCSVHNLLKLAKARAR